MRQNHYVGLTDAQVLESRAKYGANVLTPPEKDSFWKLLLEVCKHPIAITMFTFVAVSLVAAILLLGNMGSTIFVMPAIVAIATILILAVGFFGGFGDPLFKILITAFVLSMGISIYEFEWNNAEWTTFFEPIGIIVALILATSIAFWLEKNNEKTFQSLNKTNDDELVKVIRNAHTCQVPRKDIVVGDIVKLSTGEEIPADCVLLECLNLTVDESSLTGELQATKSLDENEHPDATYKANEIKKGTNIIEGYCTAEVTQVGMNTECGEVYKSLNEGDEITVGWFVKNNSTGEIIGKYSTEDDANDAMEEYLGEHDDEDVVVEQPLIDRMRVRKGSETPLSKKLNGLADWITNASYVLAVLIVIGRIVWYFITNDANFGSSEFWVEFVSYFLQTIMIAVTLIVVAVPEGLPMSVTLSLAFSMRKLMKSNTLPRTMHACETMGAASVICTDKTGTLTKNQMEVVDSKITCSDCALLAEMIATNTTADLDISTKNNTKVIGNPTEGALLLWLQKNGSDYLEIRDKAQFINRLPFSTENKYMATIVNSFVTGKKVVYVKGAPEILLEHCNISIENKKSFEEELFKYQNKAMRTLGLAYAELSENDNIFNDGKLIANNLTFVGIFAIQDDIREGVKESISDCMKAGIAVKIVTGDTPGTAKEIGRKIGLWTDADTERNIITGAEMAKMTDKQLMDCVMDLKIIARARPMDKKRLVEALQSLDQVVAVTGDGTNDAPALNKADVGLSMGNGTAVAKDASDMIIQDNSFSTIANAVMWGRSLYKNIQRFIVFQLTINFVALFIVLLGSLVGTTLPLTVTQMLWVNLIMDTFAALALASIPPSESVMKEKPRKSTDFIITKSMRYYILGMGSAFLVLLMGMLFWFNSEEGGMTTYRLTVFFTFFVMLQFWNLFNARVFGTSDSAFKGISKSYGMELIILAILGGQILIVQFGGAVFRTVPLDFMTWMTIVVSTSFVLWIGELVRLIRRLTQK